MAKRNRYTTPQSGILTCSPGTILMTSGGGRRVSSNIGLSYDPNAIDPTDAW